MTRRTRRRDLDGPVIAPVPGALGLPGGPAAGATNAGLTAAIDRWRQRRRLRRAAMMDAKLAAREILRDFNPWRGSDAGSP
jgi:hypothetical protein